ncbi:MAG: hypothetical protein KDC57_23460 [Saprospiraceae bacterium]|nr:hypothetical protein [Saprospiraceae bacterium]
MHDIEPYYHWLDLYTAADDPQSPFFGREYSEFTFHNRIYNYYIHPQWDDFGSQTLYLKILYADYADGYAILELIGEWNDAISNDIMTLKRYIIEPLMENGIRKFLLLCGNVLNFHGSDDCYYEEWREEVEEERGWICLMDTLEHVWPEMEDTDLHFHLHLGPSFNEINWRRMTPPALIATVEMLIKLKPKGVYY